MISETHQNARVNIQVINGRVEKVAEDALLKKLVWDDQTDACNNMLVVQMDVSQYQIVEPIHFILRRPKAGNGSEHYHDLEILAENGTTVITLHPGITVESVNAVCSAARKPSESAAPA